MRFLRRMAHWRHARRHRSGLAEELAFHREMIERDLVARGLPPDDARYAARRAMGNETASREDARSVWVWTWLDALRQDAAYSVRSLRASPGFTGAVVLTLALGLGANAALFSMVDRILFRAPPTLVDPATAHRVYLYRTSQGVEAERSGQYARYADLVRWTSSFSQVAGVSRRRLPIGRSDETRERSIGVVTAGFFGFFGFFDAPPELGRYFSAAEDTPPNGAAVAVLSDAAWKAHFGGRRDIIGSKVEIGPVVYTVIGVAPPGFVGLWPERPPFAYIPMSAFGATTPGPTWATSYGHAIVIAYGVAHRRHELGVRMALGARSADIVRLVVGESIRFAVSGLLIGGIVSVAAAHWIAPLLFDESPHDPAVFAVVGAVLIVTSLAASWLPARQAARVDPTTALQAG